MRMPPRPKAVPSSGSSRQQQHQKAKDISSLSSTTTKKHPSSNNTTHQKSGPRPHHVMTQPVFLQKILPFATTSHLSPATFKSVSSSWLETQTKYSGTAMCWAAFCTREKPLMVDGMSYEVVDRVKKIIYNVYNTIATQKARRNIDVSAKYLPILEQIIAACELIPSSSMVKGLLVETSYILNTYRSLLMVAISHSHFKVVEKLLTTIKSRCGAEELKSYLYAKVDFLHDTALVISCHHFERTQQEDSRKVAFLLLDMIKEFGRDDSNYLKQQLSAYKEHGMATPLMIASSAAGRGELVKSLLEGIKSVDAGDEQLSFMKELLSQRCSSLNRVIDEACQSGDREIFDLVFNEMEILDRVHQNFWKEYFTAKTPVPPLLTACAKYPGYSVVAFLHVLKHISEKEQDDTLGFLRQQLDQAHPDTGTILSACCLNFRFEGGDLKTVCTYLAQEGLLMKQYEHLSNSEKGKFIRFKIDVKTFKDKVLKTVHHPKEEYDYNESKRGVYNK